MSGLTVVSPGGVVFSGEELFFMMLYSPGTRRGLILALLKLKLDMGRFDQKLKCLTDGVLGKLEQINDNEFNDLPLMPDFVD